MPRATIKKPVPELTHTDCRVCTLLNRDEHGRAIPIKHNVKSLHTFAPAFTITQIVGAYLKRKGH